MRFLALLLLPVCSFAAITNVRVLGITNTQATILYSTPDPSSACTLEVSEESDYSPVVHDVNATFFTSANSDLREVDPDGKVINANKVDRFVVVGKRTVQRGSDNRAYSRALQTDTQHYYRITCGADQATGTFHTRTIPLGNTHGDAPVVEAGGGILNPTPDYRRNAYIIDPHTGARFQTMHTGLDARHIETGALTNFFAVTEATNWTNSANALDSDADTADYDGASCAATCDWMILTSGAISNPGTSSRLDMLIMSITGSGSSATAADRTIELGMFLEGTTTIDPDARIKEVVLPQSPTFSTVATTNMDPLGNTTGVVVDTWRLPGKQEINYVTGDILRYGIRKKNSTGTISIRHAQYNRVWSKAAYTGTAGSFDRCSSVLRSDGRYLCTAFVSGSINLLYSVDPDIGDARFLGIMYDPGFNAGVTDDNLMWSHTDPNLCYFFNSIDGKWKTYTYTGDGSDRATSTSGVHVVAAATTSEIIISGQGNGNFTTAVKNFVDANIGQYDFAFDNTKFGCGPRAVTGDDYLSVTCLRGAQDTVGWLAAYKISTSTIVAAMPHFNRPAGRWCTVHTTDNVGDQQVIQVADQVGKDLALGNGAYYIQSVGAYDTDDTEITVTSTCGGATCAGHVEGEPVSATWADNYLQPWKVGDVIVWSAGSNSEYVRITAKTSSTQMTVARAQFGTTARTHADPSAMRLFCGNAPGAGPNSYAGAEQTTVWRFLDDPYGSDINYQWMNRVISHQVSRGSVLANVIDVALNPTGQDILPNVKDPAVTMSIAQSPYFGGKYAPADGNLYQKHPHALASLPNYIYDVWPFIGGDLISDYTPGCDPTTPEGATACAAMRVSGFSNVYRYRFNNLYSTGSPPNLGANPNPDGMNPKHHSPFGVRSTVPLKDISGPGSTMSDSNLNEFCHALSTDECVTGSSAGDWYVSMAAPNSYFCSGNTAVDGIDICLSDFSTNAIGGTQFGYVTPTKEGTVFTGATQYGHGWSRKLYMQAGHHGFRNMSGFAAMKILPKGKWALAAQWERATISDPAQFLFAIVSRLGMVRVPPVVKDTVNRSTFVPVAIKIGSVPNGTDNVIVEFGYGEHGAPANLYCTSRLEPCYAVSGTIDVTDPFKWNQEVTSGLSCASGCTPVIAAYPTRVVYYRIKYRNAGNSVIFTGPIEVAVAP